MRAVTKILTAAGLAALLATPVPAQVINGESTYEDNFAHTPPPEPDQPQKSKARADGERAPTPPNDEKRRD